MKQENQTQGPSLEDRILDLGSLIHLSKDLNKNDIDPKSRVNLYNQLAVSLYNQDKSNGLTEEQEAEILKKTNYSSLLDSCLGQFRNGVDTAISFAEQRKKQETARLEPLYKEGNKKIVEEVISSIKDTLKDVKDKGQAALILSQYLEGLFGEIPKLTQTQANKYARGNLEAITGIHGFYDVQGDVEAYKGTHEQNTLIKRIITSEYLTDVKKGDEVTGYKLNEEKLVKDMENIGYGAVLYTNTKAIEEAKKKQKEAEAQKKAS